ncbi:MAG: glycosyltransferase family 4 protein, partial [Pseudonocardiaceae bacterium]
MELACAELVRRSANQVRWRIVSKTLDPDLWEFVDRWIEVRVPDKPFCLRFATFFIRGGLVVRNMDRSLTHTLGALIFERSDVSSVHFCHAGAATAIRRMRRDEMSTARRVNSWLARLFARAAEKWCFRPARVSQFAAVSIGVAAELENKFPAIPVAITPNGVDSDRFLPSKTNRERIRRAQGLGSHDLVVIFVGGDWIRKGLIATIEAVAALRSETECVWLWIVGIGDQARAQGLADQHGLGDRIRFYGHQKHLEQFYQAADIFIIPSYYETFSMVAYEAAATGLPIIGTPVSGVAELIGNNAAGVLVDDSSGTALTEALHYLVHSEEARTRLGMEARRRAVSYTWENSVSSVLQ